ncbi:hypothetical protein V8F20_011088 [Naviculisporaceae sp. PSN 640]
MYPSPKSITGIFCLALSLSYGCWQTSAAVVPAPHALAEPLIPEGDIGDGLWRVRATPDGPELHLKGTVQDIYRQLRGINPDYDRDFNVPIPALQGDSDVDRILLETATDSDLISPTPHHKRETSGKIGSTFELASIQCTNKQAKKKAITDGISSLKSNRETPTLNPLKQETCARVTCSGDSAIIWCVNGFEEVSLASWSEVAKAATALMDKCGYRKKWVGGRVYAKDDWYVVVDKQSC